MATPTTIRTDAVARIIAAATLAGSRVYDSRMTPVDSEADAFPLVSVYTASSTAKNGSLSAPSLRREERVSIECHCRAATDAATAAQMDAIEAQVLQALLGDPAWVKLYEPAVRVEIDRGRDVESRDRRGLVRLTITVPYTMQYEPAIDDALELIRIETDLIGPAGPAGAGPDGTIDVASEVDLS